jgi:hypothetical protein
VPGTSFTSAPSPRISIMNARGVSLGIVMRQRMPAAAA